MLYPSCSVTVCDKGDNLMDFFTVYCPRTASAMFAMFRGWAAKWEAVRLCRPENRTAVRSSSVQSQGRKLVPPLRIQPCSQARAVGGEGLGG